MGTSIVTIMLAALIITAVAVLGQGAFTAVGNLNDGWKAMHERTVEMDNTGIEPVGVTTAMPTVDVIVRNDGQTALRDWASWDVFLQYYAAGGVYTNVRVPYTEAAEPSNNEWTVAGLYRVAPSTPEVFQPGIFDPNEEMVIRVRMAPSSDASGANVIVIGTPNGITMRANF
jgi:hypothetical protein